MSRGSQICVILLAIAIICLCVDRGCEKEKPEITRMVDTLYIESKDTEHNITPTVQPKATYITNNYTYEASQHPIDTGAVLRDYFNKRGYQDTIRNDSIDIFLHEEVYKNELTRKKVSYRWKAPERIVKETITETKFKGGLFVGIAGGYRYGQSQGNVGIGVSAIFSTPKYSFGLMADPFQKMIYGSVSKRIKWNR